MSVESVLAMVLALGAGGLIKGATGMGLPIVAVPILAAFFGVQHAVAIMCFPGIFTNVLQVWRFRAAMRESDFLLAMLLGSAAGMLAGTWFIVSLPEKALSLALSLLILAYVGLKLTNPSFAVSRRLGRRLAPGFGFGAGVLQGATGIGSPLSVTFVHAMRLERTAHLFAVSAIFLLATVVQVPALAFAGVMTWQIALEGIVAFVPALAMMPIGNWLAARVSQSAFDRMILAMLVVLALQLGWKAFAA